MNLDLKWSTFIIVSDHLNLKRGMILILIETLLKKHAIKILAQLLQKYCSLNKKETQLEAMITTEVDRQQVYIFVICIKH